MTTGAPCPLAEISHSYKVTGENNYRFPPGVSAATPQTKAADRSENSLVANKGLLHEESVKLWTKVSSERNAPTNSLLSDPNAAHTQLCTSAHLLISSWQPRSPKICIVIPNHSPES